MTGPISDQKSMDDILTKLDEQQEKIDAILSSTQRLKAYFKWTLIITIATIVVPLIALAIALPFLISVVGSTYGNLL